MRRARRLPAIIACLWLAAASTPAAAQTPPDSSAPRPPAKRRWIDFGAGGVWVKGVSFGSTAATFETPGGSDLTVFQSSSRSGLASGLQTSLGFKVTKRLWVEAAGAWQRSTLRTRVSSDVEEIAPATLEADLSEFSAQGALVWMFSRRGRLEPFARGAVGWMRQLSGDNVYLEDGVFGSAGLGMKYWLREKDRGLFGRLALRGDVRLDIRAGGVSLGDKSRFLAPAAAASLVIER